jgi:hypothetical protein
MFFPHLPDASEHRTIVLVRHFLNTPVYYTGCLKICKFPIQSVVGKDPVELEKYLEKKIALPEEDIITLILFNT